MTYPIPSTKGDKDAIHICVQVCEAHTPLKRGELVRIFGGYAYPGSTLAYDGVVDPFHTMSTIAKGELIHIFMRPDVPRTLTHLWEDKPPQDPIPSNLDDSDECRNCYF